MKTQLLKTKNVYFSATKSETEQLWLYKKNISLVSIAVKRTTVHILPMHNLFPSCTSLHLSRLRHSNSFSLSFRFIPSSFLLIIPLLLSRQRCPRRFLSLSPPFLLLSSVSPISPQQFQHA